MRVKRGKLEHVKGHTRQYVIGQPISVKEQSEWAKKWQKLLANIKYAFTHGDFTEKEVAQELKDKFSMSEKEASTYMQQWKGELQTQSVIKLDNKIDSLMKQVNNLPEDKINSLTFLKNALLSGKIDTHVAVDEVNQLLGWWGEASSLLVSSWQHKPQEVALPPPPPELLMELKLPSETVLGISNATLEKWAKLTDAQHKEIEQVKKQFFYYKINKTNAISRLVFITEMGQPGDKQGIEDLNKILEEWGKNKYKYSKEKAKGKKPTEISGLGAIPPMPEGWKTIQKDTKEYYEVVFKIKKQWEGGTPKGLIIDSLKEIGISPTDAQNLVTVWEEGIGFIKPLPPQGIEFPKVSKTLLPENLVTASGGLPEQLGTNPGGVYKNKITGTKYYVKAYNDKQGADSGAAQARVEWLANKIYQHLGIATTQTELVFMKDFNKLCIASKWIEGAEKVPVDIQPTYVDVTKGFIADAYLKNWDVAGLDYENIVRDPVTGQMIRSDNGGSMTFRAQGSAKEFETDKIPELESMRDPNHGAGKIFKGITKEDILSQAQYLVSALKESDIDRLVDESGLTGTIREKVINGLKGRRQVLIERYSLKVPVEEQTVFALYEGTVGDPATIGKEGFAKIGEKHTAVKGKLVTFPGFEDVQFFQYKNAKGEYGVAEVVTGLNVGGSFSKEQDALDFTKQNLLKYGLEYTKKQINEWSNKAPQVPPEAKLSAWTVPKYKLPNGKILKEGGWIKYSHANIHNHYKVTAIYANNKLQVEEMDNWGNKKQNFVMTITDDITTTTEPKYKDKTPLPSANVDEKVLERITSVWSKAKELKSNYDSEAAIPKIKEFNKALHNAFEENPYIFRAVSSEAFHKSMSQILNEHVLTGSSHAKGTTCCSVSPWSSAGFGQYLFVLDKKRLVKNSDWVKPIQYYNYPLQLKEPKTFSGKDGEHADVYTAGYVTEMEVRAKHIHDPLSVIAEVWIHRDSASESDKWKLIEEVESKYPQLKGKVRVLNIYHDLKWPKGMAKSLRTYLEDLKNGRSNTRGF